MFIMECVPRNLEDITKNKSKLKKNIFKLQKEILKIRFSINFQLNKEDKEDYESWNKALQEDKNFYEGIFEPYKNEKDYAIRKRDTKISLYTYVLVNLICVEKGHKGFIIERIRQKEAGYCKRCGRHYTLSLIHI